MAQPAAVATADDLVLPFHLVQAGLSGRVVRLGAAIDTILAAHAYPEPVARALGEAIALTSLCATGLRFDTGAGDGRFILQTSTNGALPTLVAHYDVPGRLRGYARITDAAQAMQPESVAADQSVLLGKGHLAMTIQPGGKLQSYQGITPLDGLNLVEAVSAYFRQSEQLPTFLRLAVARVHDGLRWSWRAGGLMLQYIPKAGGDARPLTPAEAEARDSSLYGDDDEDWTRARLLAETVEDHELIDPRLTTEQLLLRLFHEEGVRVMPAVPLQAACRCSRERIGQLLDTFGAHELADMRTPAGDIEVTCEFCGKAYRFEVPGPAEK
jgi:molecular chaperone Hsp33